MSTPTPRWDDEPPYDPYDGPGSDLPAPGADSGPTAHIAEQAVLGAMLIDPDKAIPTVQAILRGADYADPRHETIHQALDTLHAAGQPIDPLTLAAHLATHPNGRNGRTALDHIGGPLYLHHLTTPDICPTPTSADHYAEIVRTAARRRQIINTGTRIAQIGRTGTPDQLEDAYTTAYDTLDKAAADYGPTSLQQPTTWAPVNLDPVLAGEYLDPPPTMLRRTDGIPLLYAGAVHTISGESETGKTWVTLYAALQEIQASNHVTFIDFEDRADRVIARLLALGATPTHIREHFAYIRPDRPLDDTGRHQLTPALTGRTLIIIDGVTEAMTLHGYDLNSNEDSAHFQALLPRWIADHGPAVAMIDHVVKNKDDQGRFAIGAQHKLAGIDGAAYVVKMLQPFARNKRGIAQLIIAKDRPGYVREQAFGKVIAEFTLDGTISDVIVVAELNPPGRISGRTDNDTPFEPTHIMEKISAYVQANPGLSKKAIEDATNGKAATIRLALELLTTRGYIGSKTEPRGRISHHHIKPYYETDHDPDDTTPGDPE